MIAIVGQCVVDRIKLPGQPWVERLGGAPIFAAEALAAAGAPAIVLTRGATPALRRPLHRLGLPVIEGPGTRSCVSEMAYRPDGTWSDAFHSLGDPFTADDVRSWMAAGTAGADAIVCGAQWCDDFADATLEALAEGGRPLYLDGQGPLRAAQLGPISLRTPLAGAGLRHLTVLKLAEEEARVALGGVDAAAAGRLGIPTVVVTLGERGAVVLRGGRAIEVGVEPVHGLADTVGAGDAFLALMAAGASEGADPVEAAHFACRETARLLRRRLTASTREPSRLRVRPRAVLFDFGGTLDADGETWKARAFRLFQEAGVTATPAAFDRAFHDADDTLTGAVSPTLSLSDTVHRLYRGTAERLGVPGATTVAARLARRFLAASEARFRANAPLLRRLSAVYPMGIVSNFYGNLAAVCDEAGIGQYFKTLVDSERVGSRKPDPAIFHHALRDLGVPPAEALFVGDSRPRDMAGARAIDMPHVWLRPDGPAGEAPCCPDDVVVHSLAELEAVLL
jgi:putative hydrolase of the HAD superfamily